MAGSYSTTVPLRMPDSMVEDIERAVERTGLSRQDLMRKAIEIGLPIFTRAISRAVDEAQQAGAEE